jgi:hypothetical protein
MIALNPFSQTIFNKPFTAEKFPEINAVIKKENPFIDFPTKTIPVKF